MVRCNRKRVGSFSGFHATKVQFNAPSLSHISVIRLRTFAFDEADFRGTKICQRILEICVAEYSI